MLWLYLVLRTFSSIMNINTAICQQPISSTMAEYLSLMHNLLLVTSPNRNSLDITSLNTCFYAEINFTLYKNLPRYPLSLLWKLVFTSNMVKTQIWKYLITTNRHLMLEVSSLKITDYRNCQNTEKYR